MDSSHNNRLPSIALLAIGISYPFLIYFGLTILPSWLMVGLVIAYALMRFKVRAIGILSQGVRVTMGFAIAIIVGISLIDPELAVKTYPITVSLGLAAVFGHSLLVPPPIVEVMARSAGHELPPEAENYVRGVTWVWFAFLIFNAALSSWTAVWGTREQWLIYNGLISYLLIGSLFGCEYLARQRLLRSRL